MESPSMPRHRTKPTNEFLEELIESRGYATLKDAADSAGMSPATVYGFADVTNSHQKWNALLTFCEAMNISVDDFVRGMLKRPRRSVRQH